MENNNNNNNCDNIGNDDDVEILRDSALQTFHAQGIMLSYSHHRNVYATALDPCG